MKAKMPLHGLVAAAHTPFAADGSLNLAIVEKQCAHLLKNKVTQVFIGGSTGESHSVGFEERTLLADRWAAVVKGTPMRLIVHVGSNCLRDARALAAQAEKLGAVAISALAPSYFKPGSLDRLIDCCAEIAGGAPNTPFYFYDIPVLTNVNFSMAEFLEKGPARIPTLAGIKFTNSDLMAYQMALRAAGGAFDVPWGVDEFMLAALALGSKGAVGSSFNFAAPVYHRLMAAFERGDMETARAEQWKSVQLIQALAAVGYMGAAKALMGWLGVDVGAPRLPQATPTAEQLKALRARLEAMGFFDWIR